MAMTSSGTGNSADMWGRTQLKDVAAFRNGQRDTNTAVDGGEFPFFVCSTEVLRCDQFDFDDEAVVMAGNNAEGIFHLHHFVGKFAARQRTYVITPSTDRLDCRWLFHQLTLLQPQFQAAAIGTTTRYVTIDMLRRAEILLPGVKVQRAISRILSDVDALLGGLDRLITKKRDLKQAAMQQLLTGQTRLPGFHGEWEVKRLGDFVMFLRNGVNSRAELLPEGRVKYLHYGDVHACKDVYLSPASLPCLPDAKAASLDRLRDGDLIFADASEDVAGVSKSVEVRGVGSSDVVSGLHTIAVRFDKKVLADGFKGFLQFCPPFATHLRRLAAGTKVYATNRAHVAGVEMRLPTVPEQTAIAAVLSDMDAELAALEARRDKTRDLKQAMMQELLTGRTRLV
jgi:type I restriction enzyme S subunit